MAHNRDNVRAGLFVLAGFVLGIAIVAALSWDGVRGYFQPTRKADVFFKLADGLNGLKVGAEVTLGDIPVGQVLHIEEQYEPTDDGSERVVGALVRIAVPRRVRLYQDAAVELVVPTFGSNTKLNIRNVGKGDPYTGDQPLAGSVAPNLLTKQLVAEAGVGDVQREQIRRTIANIESLTKTLSEDVPELTAQAKHLLAALDPMLDEANAAITNVRAATEDVRTLTADARERSGLWFERIDSVTAGVDRTVGRVDTFLSEQEPSFAGIVENLHAITQQARDHTMAQVTQTLETAQAAMDNLNVSLAELRNLAVSQRPIIERALANAQLTTVQLKLAGIELRRAPWRLLYKPSDQELETDNLYDAARSFAQAAEALDATVHSLQTVMDKGLADDDELQRRLDYLMRLFDRFQEAETSFWQALGRDATPMEAQEAAKP